MLKLNKIRRFLAIVVVLAAGGLAVTIVVKLYATRGGDHKTARLRPAADASLQKIRYTETKQGRQQWELTAEKAEYGKDADVTRLSGVRLVVAAAATKIIAVAKEFRDLHLGERKSFIPKVPEY